MRTEIKEDHRVILALVEDAKRGDKGAFGELIRIHADLAYGLAFAYMKNAVDAEDASQDAFIKAFKSLGSYSGPDKFKSWLLTIVANTCKNRLRWQRIRNRWTAFSIHQEGPNGMEHDVGELEWDGTAGAAERGSLAEEMKRALGLLPHQQNIAVQLKFVEGHKIREIAKMMGLSEGTVKTHIHRGLSCMKKILRDDIYAL